MPPTFIDGIQVLNTIPAQEGSSISPLTACVIGGLIIGLISALYGFFSEYMNFEDIKCMAVIAFLYFLVGSIIGIGLGAIVSTSDCKESVPESYEVLVSDNVRFNDFINNYEIIEINGDIITITIKE